MRVSRNDPCPCGSGKKYKKCCLGGVITHSIDNQLRDNFLSKVRNKFEGKVEKIVYKDYGPKRSVSKISSLILDLVDGFFHEDDSFGYKRFVVTIGIIAWNVAIMGKDKTSEEIATLMNSSGMKTDPEAEQTIAAMIKSLVHRKNSMFPEVKNIIFDFEVIERGDDFNLQVAYNEKVA